MLCFPFPALLLICTLMGKNKPCSTFSLAQRWTKQLMPLLTPKLASLTHKAHNEPLDDMQYWAWSRVPSFPDAGSHSDISTRHNRHIKLLGLTQNSLPGGFKTKKDYERWPITPMQKYFRIAQREINLDLFQFLAGVINKLNCK